ncbi:MAG: RNase P subunit p30 family protein [Candidatus Woesearchaeota archaeon]|jgi:RNase P/RNase MRP subunit p30|nr:RNase P subunit p30 family protein [Candidatus Woesearchaeota archaeon]MDP7506185.1 RNase P subunit p30 family protein [Candidatus Woesearchaeota archaeon]MDP7610630.1 RNase P subunit p30 family protein [Candidatus Woesearchaeota archaeon]|tara:strand:+ start:8626 stop:9189 length:564 start_codon:yes stop_codon:yes gene_type:complete
MDIVFPKNNENDFIELAEKLGYNSLCLVYKLKSFKNSYDSKIKLTFGVLAEPNEVRKAKKLSEFVFVKSSDKDRAVMENNKNLFLFGLEKAARHDFIHHRAGLNQVLCKIAYKNKIKICIPFSDVLNSEDVERANILGRMLQNIRICRKYKVEVFVGSFASEPFDMRTVHDLTAFGKVLGMNTPFLL